jgi:hypothetical protein
MTGTFSASTRFALLRTGTTLALAFALSTSVKAGPIQFNPSGGVSTPTYNITGLGFGAGNGVAINAIPPGGGLTVGETFTFLYQTHLTSLTGPNAPAAVPGLNSTFQITEVATLTETVTAVSTSNGTTTAVFALAPNAANNISIYENNAVVFSDANGTGFTSGIKIMSLNPTSYNPSQFSNSGGTTTFNQTGAGNNSGTGLAVNGSGSTSINSGVGPYNSSYFVTPGLASSLISSNLTTYFDSVSPATTFFNGYMPTIGAVNGSSGPDIEFQISGFTQSFTPVPEPASIIMSLMGLGGMTMIARRRRRATAA